MNKNTKNKFLIIVVYSGLIQNKARLLKDLMVFYYAILLYICK